MASASSSAASMPHPALRPASAGLNRAYSSRSRSVLPSCAGQLHPAAFQVVSAAQQDAITEESARAVWHASPRGATTSLSVHLAGSYVADAASASDNVIAANNATRRAKGARRRAGSTGRRVARGFAGWTRAAGMVSAACVSTACVRGRGGVRSSEAGTTMIRVESVSSPPVDPPSSLDRRFFATVPTLTVGLVEPRSPRTKGPSRGLPRPLCTTKESIFEDGERPFRTSRFSPNRPRSDARVGGSRDPRHRASPGAAGRKMSH